MQRDLEVMHQHLLRMAGLVEAAIRDAVRALRDGDLDLARQVIEGDDPIDTLENQVDDDCYRVIALHQPVAGDLRRITTGFMISADLERMGDLARSIAERTEQALAPPPLPAPAAVWQMAELVTGMVRQSLDAYVGGDPGLARTVIRQDDEVDALNAAVIDEIKSAMKRSADLIEPGMALFSVVRNLERIADHATNIAEDALFLIEGEVARHRPERLLLA
jgi:phosphate transport system protein